MVFTDRWNKNPHFCSQRVVESQEEPPTEELVVEENVTNPEMDVVVEVEPVNQKKHLPGIRLLKKLKKDKKLKNNIQIQSIDKERLIRSFNRILHDF